MNSLRLDAKKTALVLIDLQNAVVGMPTAPYSAAEVLRQGRVLARSCRAQGAMIVYVRVQVGDMLRPPVDAPYRGTDSPPPASASELAPESGFESGDVLITKRSWGAFGGTDLEQQLKRRGIETIVLGGIATNFGVESTAREAAGLGFALVIVEDACTSLDAPAHRFAFETIFPRLARVRKTDEVVAALAAAGTKRD